MTARQVLKRPAVRWERILTLAPRSNVRSPGASTCSRLTVPGIRRADTRRSRVLSRLQVGRSGGVSRCVRCAVNRESRILHLKRDSLSLYLLTKAGQCICESNLPGTNLARPKYCLEPTRFRGLVSNCIPSVRGRSCCDLVTRCAWRGQIRQVLEG